MKQIYGYLLSLAVVVLTTFLAWITQTLLDPTEMIMFYLLGVVIVALNWGHGPAIFASLASVLVLDYYFIYPQFSFWPHHTDLIVLIIFLIVGLVISILTARARTSALLAKQSEMRKMELLQEKEKLQTILLHSLSHDLRTPLFSIHGVLGSLLKNKHLDNEMRQELVKTAHEESARLSRVVGNLLDMTKVEAGTLDMSLKPCDVRDLIGASLQQFSEEQMQNRHVTVRVAEDLPEIILDFTLMMRVLVNLIDNAIKYSAPNLPIEIAAQNKEGKLQIEIMDHGMGIPKKDLALVFEKFYRVEQVRKIGGIGLGLSICKGIVEAHKGEIYAENCAEGAKIVLTLPFVTSH